MTNQEKRFLEDLKKNGVDIEKAPPVSRVVELTLPKGVWECFDAAPPEVLPYILTSVILEDLVSGPEIPEEILKTIITHQLSEKERSPRELSRALHEWVSSGLPSQMVVRGVTKLLETLGGGEK